MTTLHHTAIAVGAAADAATFNSPLSSLDAAFPVTAYWQPATNADVAIPGTATAISTANLRRNFVVGPSGGAVVDLSGYVVLGANADIYWGVVVGATGFGPTVLALNGYTAMLGVKTLCRARLVVPAATWTPGSTQQIDWTHFATVTNAATLFKVEAPYGWVASMTVSPL